MKEFFKNKMLEHIKKLKTLFKDSVQNCMIENQDKINDDLVLYCINFDTIDILDQELIYGDLLEQEKTLVDEISNLLKFIEEKVKDAIYIVENRNGTITYDVNNRIFIDGFEAYSGDQQISQQFIEFSVKTYKQLNNLDNIYIMSEFLSDINLEFFLSFEGNRIHELHIKLKEVYEKLKADYQQYILKHQHTLEVFISSINSWV
ncbi:hypothetical protein AB837_00515 [bacterium AB1]|nr:hypothetical protein AB837_00515 [bacterium AB1]